MPEKFWSMAEFILRFRLALDSEQIRSKRAKNLLISRWIWHWDEAATKQLLRRKTVFASLAERLRA